MYKNILSSIVCNSVNLKTVYCSSTFEWTNKLNHIKTIEQTSFYYMQQLWRLSQMKCLTKAATKELHVV